MPTQVPRRTPASFPTKIQEDAFSDSSASPRDLSPLVSGMVEIVTALLPNLKNLSGGLNLSRGLNIAGST